MNKLNGFKLRLNQVLSAICAFMLAFMTFVATYQVFARYVLKSPSTMSEDILSYSFVWTSLLAAALVFGERDHMNLTLFLDKTKPLVQLFLSLFSEVLIAIIAVAVFIVGGKGFMNVGSMQISPTLGITMNLIYMILPISGILIIIYNIINIVELIMQYKMKKEVE